MATTAVQALRYPALGDAANGPVAVQNLALDVEPKLVMVFASAAARTTLVPAPTEGMTSWLQDVNQLNVYDGAAWKVVYQGTWTAYTPTVGGTGWAIGNATHDCAYVRLGNTIHFRLMITWGSTSTYGASALQLGVPVNAVGGPTWNISGNGIDISAANARYPMSGQLSSGGAVCLMFCPSATAGNQDRGVLTATPFAWATGDIIQLNGTYQA